jgi:predicted MPP superfamily phosphohydrolase
LVWDFDEVLGMIETQADGWIAGRRRTPGEGNLPVALTRRLGLNRRKFLKQTMLAAGTSALAAGGAYPFVEARWCRVVHQTIALPNLPASFAGTRLALLSDIHHSPVVPLDYIRHVVAMTNALKPDLIALTGDFITQEEQYIDPVMDTLGALRAKFGRFAVLGNHDNQVSWAHCQHAITSAKIELLDNQGIWIDRGRDRLRIGGVGDLWTQHQDLGRALGDASREDAVVVLSHNPDMAETLPDDRVGLLLCGHTHGGQVVVPGYGAPRVPSRYGQKYLQGLVQGPRCQVFVTRGVGTVSPPVRLFCRPEVVLITLI